MPLLFAGSEIFFDRLIGELGNRFRFELERRVRKAALDHREEHGGALRRLAIDLGFVREFEADGIAFYPADGGFETEAFSKPEFDDVPQPGLETATDHRPAARQIHYLDVVRFALMENRRRFAAQAMAITAAVIAVAGLGSRNVHVAQCVALATGPRNLVRYDQWLAFTTKDSGAETVTRGLDTHAATF